MQGKILIAKPGLDGHDRGAKYIARCLRDAGCEVVYTGIRRTPEEIAAIAVQEDVDAIGLSILSGAHMELFPAVLSALANVGAAAVPVVGGGVIPDEDVTRLKEYGIFEILTPGAPMKQILQVFDEAVNRSRKLRAL